MTITINQYEAGMNWIPLVRAAGLYSEKQHTFSVYLLAGAIMRDEVVAARVAMLPGNNASVPEGSYETIVSEMTDSERAALKARIVAKFKKHP